MKKINLAEKLQQLRIPKSDEAKKNAAIQAAVEEFALSQKEARKKVKGFDEAGRLTSIQKILSLLKGGLVMNRPIIVSTTLAGLALLLTLTFVPRYMEKSLMAPPVNQPADQTEKVAAISPAAGGYGAAGTAQKDVFSKPFPDKMVERKAQKAPGVTSQSPEPSIGANAIKENQSGGSAEKQFDSQVILRSEKADSSVMTAITPMAGRIHEESKSGALGARSTATAPNSITAGGCRPPFPVPEGPAPSDHEYAGQDKFEQQAANPVKMVAEEPVSTFSVDVDTASYAFVRRAINEGHLPQKAAVRIEEMINYFDYDYEVPKDRNLPFKPTVAVYPTPWNTGTKLLHIGIKGYDIVKKERQRSNLVFLIDVSGSMSSPDKLPLLKNSLKLLVEELGPEDSVAITVYAGNAGTVLEPTKVKEKGKIISALDRLTAGGSTAGGEGIRLAYSLAEANSDPKAVNRVILATDGDFNVGIQNPEELKGFVERKRKSGIYLTVLGFGQGNLNDALMQKLAQNGNGNAAYIDTLSEARKVLVEEASATLFAIAKDVKVQVEFNPATVAEYRLIGYESRMLRREDFNNDHVDAGDIGSGHSVTAIYEITPVNSSARLMDNLRYKSSASLEKNGQYDEYAFLKIRFKLPSEEQSRLITVPVDRKMDYAAVHKLPDDLRFAAAVAAFGQILRGDSFVQKFSYDEVIKLAESARGFDRFGYRTEFLNLVRLAKSAGAMGNR